MDTPLCVQETYSVMEQYITINTLIETLINSLIDSLINGIQVFGDRSERLAYVLCPAWVGLT